MKTCMETDRPLVSIVMATYNPRMDWLREQLISLENQSYEALELIVLDDCSTKVALDEIKECVADCIKRIPYQILQNEENLGSTKTFEKLTLLAKGEYIAYCDQDDVWHEDKIETCYRELKSRAGVLAFSDCIIIDGIGTLVANSITEVRKHHKFYDGKGLGQRLLFSNFVTGCTMLIETNHARAAIPFCPFMVHDHWLALYCATDNILVFIDQPLIDYRIHQNNQTLTMAGVNDKSSYVKLRIDEAIKKFLWLKERFSENRELHQIIENAVVWMDARKQHFDGSFKSIITIWKYRKYSYWTAIFELFAPYLPERIFRFVIGLKRRNII